MPELIEQANTFLAGRALTFQDADRLWKKLKNAGELSLARRVLKRLRDGEGLLDAPPADRATKARLCQQEALLTSKDPESSVAQRHDRALEILAEEFDLRDHALDRDAETLGIAGGILKRRWSDLGQPEDLKRAENLYSRAAGPDLGDDAYAHINAAFTHDLLAYIGDNPEIRRQRARELREVIAAKLPVTGSWWNAASRAEALLGLGRYKEATAAVAACTEKPHPWQLEAAARQLAHVAHLRVRPSRSPAAGEAPSPDPLADADLRTFFETLLPGAADSATSAMIGKVGLALSGGGFRAAFYHLGVLARLAELNVLRHVDVLSCVSGGSIVGACYWLALRQRLLQPAPLGRGDYVVLVKDLIERFQQAVATDLRRSVQPSLPRITWRFLTGKRGILDPGDIAAALEERFYRPLLSEQAPIYMHHLPFTPGDHNPDLAGARDFHPGRHNWLRAHKVPVLVLNATSVNTGHAWQFTPTWMGEAPWAVQPEADSIPRLEWAWYRPEAGWQMELGRAVAASAGVPGVFAPLEIGNAYEGVQVQLVDGGVHDNQGTVSLLAHNCNVLLVSDAGGQLMLERQPNAMNFVSYVHRPVGMLMERVRLANYGDLAARQRTGLLRGLMFLHMKAGLDADPIPLRFAPPARLDRKPLSPSGVRKDFQQALAELRTDLDAFTADESNALMACGYQMTAWTFDRDLKTIAGLWNAPVSEAWPFAELLSEITSIAPTPRRTELLEALRRGAYSTRQPVNTRRPK